MMLILNYDFDGLVNLAALVHSRSFSGHVYDSTRDTA